MVQFQALACGLPLICTDSTGGEDLLARGGAANAADDLGIREFPAGYVVPTGSSRAIAECLKRLHSDRDLLTRKRSAALALRDQDISWGRYAEANLKMYERLTGRHSG